jgi:hypothetical protein
MLRRVRCADRDAELAPEGVRRDLGNSRWNHGACASTAFPDLLASERPGLSPRSGRSRGRWACPARMICGFFGSAPGPSRSSRRSSSRTLVSAGHIRSEHRAMTGPRSATSDRDLRAVRLRESSFDRDPDRRAERRWRRSAAARSRRSRQARDGRGRDGVLDDGLASRGFSFPDDLSRKA